MIDIRKVLVGALKGYEVSDFELHGDTIVAHLANADGQEYTLRLEPTVHCEATAEARADAEAPPPPELTPTVMAPVAGAGFRQVLERMTRDPKLPAEAKALIKELAAAPRRQGDEAAIVIAAQSAAAGDLAPLRNLVRQHAPPREMHA